MLDEFPQLVLPFEAAFRAHMAMWRMAGKPRAARRFPVYKNCPLPTPEDRLFFHALPGGPGAAPRRPGDRRSIRGCLTGGGIGARRRRTGRCTSVPPCAHDGTERRIVRPQDAPQQTACYSGKKKDHTVKNVLLVNAPHHPLSERHLRRQGSTISALPMPHRKMSHRC
jgi:hypothetical protein